MKLLNFSLLSPVQGITLIGLGCEWDLHNFAKFAGFRFDPVENSLLMEWSVPRMDNPWGWFENRAIGCRLKFRNVKWMDISARDESMPMSEDVCLFGISKVIPDRTEHRFKSVWLDDEPFHLLLEFQSGRSIEVASDTVELESIE